ncbi:MAG: hypothetical protein RJA13_327 [Bacteroidota bacterium]|jgi:hypothetical protein
MSNTFTERSNTISLYPVAENIVVKTNLMKVNVNNLPATVVI